LNNLKDYSAKSNFRYWDYLAYEGVRHLENGNIIFKMSMGLSMLNAPFFFLGHIYAKTFGYESHGFSTPYKTAMIVGCLFYFFISLIILRKLLKQLNFSEVTMAFTLFVITFGTNLFFYISIEPAMSHAYNFSLI